MGQLDRILEAKREELASLRRLSLPEPPPRRTVQLLRQPGEPLRLIAEIKRRSPSAGQLSTLLSVAERAQVYQRSGASMLSVLCDQSFFDGSYQHLAEARSACNLPLLCKEFVLDEVQLRVARAYGADAVLLIVRCLDAASLQRLIARSRELALVPFVEIASSDEAETALACGADVIGVNARDLDTLQMDVARAQRILKSLPTTVTKIHLSGVASPERVSEINASPADAALIGEVLMRQDDPGPLLTTFAQAASNSP